jgi:uncharacterized small protein (DUF1192 family)
MSRSQNLRPARRRSPLTVRQVQGAVSEAIEILEHYIVTPHQRGEAVDPQELARLTHALTQAAVAYRGLLDVAEFQGELGRVREDVARLEAELRTRDGAA